MAVLALLSVPSGASADYLARIGTFLEVGSQALGERHPDVAYSDKSDAYLVVWGDGSASSVRPAYAQLVSKDGAKIGARLTLTSCGGELYGMRPRVAYTAGTSDDVFVVTYREWCSGVVNLWVHIVKYSTGGAISVSRTKIRENKSTAKANGIVYNAQRKEVVVVWEEMGNGWDAVARVVKFTRDGSTVTGVATPLEPVIAVGGLGLTQGMPRIALDPGSQSYLVTFQGENPSNGQNAMMVRTIDAATGALSPLTIAGEGGWNVESSIVYLAEVDQFLVTWRQGSDIVGRRFTPVTGAAASSTYPLIARPGTDGATGAAYDAAAGVGMVAGMNSDYYVWASQFSSSGTCVKTFQGSIATPNTNGGGTFFPQVAATGEGQLGLVYGLDNTKINLERFSTSGGASGTCGGGSPAPPPAGTVNLTGLTASPTPPVTVGTPITWTGVATGGTIEYQFWVLSAGAWSMKRDWSTTATYVWTPTVIGEHAVQVWARLQGQSSYQWKSSGVFNVNPASAVPASLSLTNLTVSPSLPQPAGTTITWTAAATVGSGGTAEYQFWLSKDGAWSVGRAWGSSNVWEWTPTTAGQYAVQVWARLVGQTAFQYRSSGYFNITPSTAPVATLTLIGIAADPVPPLGVNVPVTWSALSTVSDGATAEYQYWLFTGATNSWTVARAWAPSNTFTWTPTATGTFAFQVWTRLVGSSAFQYAASGYFSVTSTAPDTPPVVVTSLTSNPSGTYTAGSPIVWTANATGTGTLEYAYWVYRQSTNTWTLARSYSTTKTFSWTPPASGTYALQVWVRRTGQTLAYEAYQSSGYFVVN